MFFFFGYQPLIYLFTSTSVIYIFSVGSHVIINEEVFLPKIYIIIPKQSYEYDKLMDEKKNNLFFACFFFYSKMLDY